MKAYYVDDLGLDEDEITDDGKAMRAKIYLAAEVNVRIADLEREKHDLQSALRELLQDTQHVNHNCGDTSDRCPVLRAREVLNELMESVTK